MILKRRFDFKEFSVKRNKRKHKNWTIKWNSSRKCWNKAEAGADLATRALYSNQFQETDLTESQKWTSRAQTFIMFEVNSLHNYSNFKVQASSILLEIFLTSKKKNGKRRKKRKKRSKFRQSRQKEAQRNKEKSVNLISKQAENK